MISADNTRVVRIELLRRLVFSLGIPTLFQGLLLFISFVNASRSLFMVACAGLLVGSGSCAGASESFRADFQSDGLQSITFDGTQVLKRGEPRVRRVVWDSGEAFIVPGDYSPTTTFNPKERRLEQTWSMGRLACVYRPGGNKLDLKLTFTNTSNRRIRSVELRALDFVFPQTPTGNGWYQDLHTFADTVDDVAAVFAHYGKGTLAVAQTNFDTEAEVMIEKDFERAQPGYNLLISTISRDASDLRHVDGCRLDPGRSVTFDISVRFGPEKSGLSELAGDLFKKYGQEHPRVLHWADRRPISMLMLASVAKEHHSATNPRGWLNDPHLDVLSPDGKEIFKERVLAWARRSVSQCLKRGAQGVIAWDIEGEEFCPIVYVGDPRRVPVLAPEFDEVADEFFKIFTDAGLKTGVCLRPSRVERPSAGAPWSHVHMGFDPAAELSAKIAYAKKRWGCTLFYVDTNVTWAYPDPKHDGDDVVPTSWPMRAPLMRRVAERHPDVLIAPEFQYPGYYSHISGYKELRQGYAATPARVLLAYPEAFSVINLADGPIGERRADLVAAVRRGDILMFRGWFNAPENASEQSIYEEARDR